MKTITEQAIEAAMRGDIDDETFDLVLDIDLRVQKQVTCPVTGEVLDSRTAALLTVTGKETTLVAIAPHAVEDAVELVKHLGEVTVQAIPTEALEVLR